jgi:hypothetical protein
MSDRMEYRIISLRIGDVADFPDCLGCAYKFEVRDDALWSEILGDFFCGFGCFQEYMIERNDMGDDKPGA